MTTTTSASEANDVKVSKNGEKRKSVSCHSTKHLSLNSLFLRSLGDDDGHCSSSLVNNNNKFVHHHY